MNSSGVICLALLPADPMAQERAEIAQGLRGGDPELVDRLILQYQHRLFRYLLWLTASRETAEDLFQETWLRVLERGHQYRAQWTFESWLFSIARHLVIDWARRKKPLSLEELTGASDEAGARPPAPEPRSNSLSGFEMASRQEEGLRVATAVEQLPAAFREVVVLRFQEEMKLEEIARVVRTPLSTVKSRLYRALLALRERLEGSV